MIKQLWSNEPTAFGLLGLLSLIGYGVMRLWFPLAPHYRQVPLSDVRTFAPSLAGGLAYAALLLALFGLAYAAYRLIRQAVWQPRPWLILGSSLLFALPLLQTYPINATDIFRYWLHGRVTATYHANTYTTAPNAFPDDPYLPLAGEWAGESSPYGPVWEMTAAAIATATPNNLYAGLILLKLVGLVAFLLCGWLIWLLLAEASPGRRAGYTLLWGWNPALLLMFVVDAHNDALMLFWLLLGLWVMRRGYLGMGLVIMLLAALSKPIALLPLPFFFIACWRELPGWGARGRFLLSTAVGSLILLFITFAPFGSPFPLSAALGARLARESGSYPGFSPATLILLILQAMQGSLTAAHLNGVANVGRLLFLLLAGWVGWRTWHGRSPLRATADIFFGYLAQALAFRIWYATWPFPWLLLEEPPGEKETPHALPYRLRVGLLFLLTTQLSVVIYGHLHIYLLAGANLPTHLIGLAFTFGLPFLLAALPEWRTR